MKNVGNSAGNGLHITKDKKPLASTPLRKHNFNFGFKMLQVRLSEGNSKRRRKIPHNFGRGGSIRLGGNSRKFWEGTHLRRV